MGWGRCSEGKMAVKEMGRRVQSLSQAYFKLQMGMHTTALMPKVTGIEADKGPCQEERAWHGIYSIEGRGTAICTQTLPAWLEGGRTCWICVALL